MFLRLLISAAAVERARTLTAVLALTVVAATVSALLNLYVDVQAKLRREFRGYGANLVVLGSNGQTLPEDALERVDATIGGRGVAAPFAYVVARTSDGSPVVVAGTDMERARKLNSWWWVTRWPHGSLQALLGTRAAIVLGADRPFDLSFRGRTLRLSPAGTLQTGAAEDSRIYLSMHDFVAWTSVGLSAIEISASGTPEEIASLAESLAAKLPEAEIRPVRQLVEAETRVLGRTRMTFLAVTGVIILTAALCVLSTLMAAVFDRRKDFALMKALGASEGAVHAVVAAEAALLGAVAALPGYLLGAGIAAWISQASFHAGMQPRLIVLPPVLAGSVLLAVLSAVAPILSLRRIQPAALLKGE